MNKSVENGEASAGSGSGTARIILGVALLGAVVAALFFLPVKDYLLSFFEWARGTGIWGPVAVAAIYVVAAVLFVPGSILTLGAGFVFGVAKGFLAVWIGANLGAAAAFLVGRTIARDWIARKVAGNPRFEAIDNAVGTQGFKIVFLTRLSPVFPFSLLNYMFGLTKVRFRDYVLASLIGMIPGGLMYVYLGSALGSLAQVAAGKVEGGPAQQVFFWVGLAATVVVALYVTKIARKALKEAVPAESATR